MQHIIWYTQKCFNVESGSVLYIRIQRVFCIFSDALVDVDNVLLTFVLFVEDLMWKGMMRKKFG